MKKKKNNFYFFIIIISILGIILLSYKLNFFKNNNKDLPSKENIYNKENKKIKEKPKEKTEDEKKLDILNNIDKKISFLKKENLDRYINYKEKNPNLSDEDIIIKVNIGLDKHFYTNTKEAPDKHKITVLANKYNFLGSDYIPKNLTQLNYKCSSRKQFLVSDAKEAFEKLCFDAINNGYHIVAISSYRSYNHQQILYNNYVKKDGVKYADRYSSRAGFSDHQTGLVVDVAKYNHIFTGFINTKEYIWMKDNAHKYGFILRYPKNKEDITGYMFESWHYRYVGIDIANYIYENNITYEEYFVKFLDNK